MGIYLKLSTYTTCWTPRRDVRQQVQ